MTSVPCNPFSWSAVDRAHRLGLCTLFVREELALPVPLDAVGVYLQFNVKDSLPSNIRSSGTLKAISVHVQHGVGVYLMFNVIYI